MIKKHDPVKNKGGKINCLVCGGVGTGKTLLIYSLIHHGYNPIVFDFDKGLLTLDGYLRKYNKDVDVSTIEHEFDKEGKIQKHAWNVFREDYNIVTRDIKSRKSPYDVIIIDHISELAKICQDFYTKGNKENENVTQKQWGQIVDSIRKLTRDIRDLPIHSYIISQIIEEKDDMSRVMIKPNVVGKMSGELPGFFDEVFYLTIGEKMDEGKEAETYRYLITCNEFVNGMGKVHGKDRSGVLDAHETPDLGAIFKNILNGKKEESKKTNNKKSNNKTKEKI